MCVLCKVCFVVFQSVVQLQVDVHVPADLHLRRARQLLAERLRRAVKLLLRMRTLLFHDHK